MALGMQHCGSVSGREAHGPADWEDWESPTDAPPTSQSSSTPVTAP